MVTGGAVGLQTVSQYSLTGEVTWLPDLTTGRNSHACSKFVSDGVTVSEGVRCRNQRSVEYVRSQGTGNGEPSNARKVTNLALLAFILRSITALQTF